VNRRGDLATDHFTLSDFKLAGKEKIGERNTQVIQYTVKWKGKSKNPTSRKMWLDARTNLPVKLAITGGASDISDITESYREFAIDAKVNPKLLQLRK
jgi:hypothetical protein